LGEQRSGRDKRISGIFANLSTKTLISAEAPNQLIKLGEFQKARAIKIPKTNSEKWRVEYRWEEGDRFCGFSLVKASIPEYSKWSTRLPYLDLSWLRRRKAHDKRGDQNLIRDFRHHYFRDRNLTKKRCEAFFENAENFIDAHRSIQAGS
jgi:hypothetical protein